MSRVLAGNHSGSMFFWDALEAIEAWLAKKLTQIGINNTNGWLVSHMRPEKLIKTRWEISLQRLRCHFLKVNLLAQMKAFFESVAV